MMNDDQKPAVRQALDHELQHESFEGHDAVLKRTHPVSWKERLANVWNKEVRIPVVPLGAALFLLITAGTIIAVPGDEPERELIERGGSYYWHDLFEEEDSS